MPHAKKEPRDFISKLRGDHNILRTEPIDDACWIWHPGAGTEALL